MNEYHKLRVRTMSRIISTDDIIPGRYKHMYTDTDELAKHVFENIFPGLADTFAPGDVICSADTFGIGSSREQAVSSLISAGIHAVIAPRFGRIFFRNAWNLGLVAIEIARLPITEGDQISIDLDSGELRGDFGLTRFAPPPNRMLEMVKQGGLLAMISRQLASQSSLNEGGTPQ
ncbi:hypothetical protein RBA63_01490 [Brenneria goodwinii]|uniref:LeuD/DmdB family oxidoreductase small subunit n=1 Tax=Brenneria goodwinii TaxID=1109412 RepID=UPI00065E290D|nr:3-isopropylmalate dehydratase small subunit [Brenneria goodwinii]